MIKFKLIIRIMIPVTSILAGLAVSTLGSAVQIVISVVVTVLITVIAWLMWQ